MIERGRTRTKLLILGGTSEATALGRVLATDARFDATISLAGRTSRPAPQPLPHRSGGFGGAEGLARFLNTERIEILVDATHPFATQMSRNAAVASRNTGTDLLTLYRPAWKPAPGDRWIEVPTMLDAAHALGRDGRRVLLTVGRQDLAPFAIYPWHHYVIRSVDLPEPGIVPAGATLIAARGPFDEAAEQRLLREHRIDILLTKNAGGEATAAKLRAARALRLPVIMVARPPAPEGNVVNSVTEALAWLHASTARRDV